MSLSIIAPMAVLLSCITALTSSVPFKLTVFSQSSGVFSVGDIDGDGRNDIVGTKGSASLWWRRYPDMKCFTIATLNNGFSMEVHAADIDSDGDMDVIVPEEKTRTLVWFENPRPKGNPGSDLWKRHVIGTWPTGYPHDFKIGDLNGDGKVDAVINPNEKSPFYIFIQRSPDLWDSRAVGMNDFEGMWVADLNRDGKDDFTDGKYWWESPSDPLAGEWKRYNVNASPVNGTFGMSAADMDGDGDIDIVSGENGRSSFDGKEETVIWENMGKGSSFRKHVVAVGKESHHGSRAFDLDKDGDMDIVSIGYDAKNIIHVWRNDAIKKTVGTLHRQNTQGNVNLQGSPRYHLLDGRLQYSNMFASNHIVITSAVPTEHLPVHSRPGTHRTKEVLWPRLHSQQAFWFVQ